jgi:hypothetical protein
VALTLIQMLVSLQPLLKRSSGTCNIKSSSLFHLKGPVSF